MGNYDYVLTGAGCVLAARFSEDGGSVLLDAGGEDICVNTNPAAIRIGEKAADLVLNPGADRRQAEVQRV